MSLILALLLFLLGASGTALERGSATYSAPTASPGPASLVITVWPSGPKGRSFTWTLRCAPAGGSLPRPAAACRRLNLLRAPFAPVPAGRACTEIYGGPQVARIRGSFRGRRVDARFKRSDGCEIERWDRVRFLFPVRR